MSRDRARALAALAAAACAMLAGCNTLPRSDAHRPDQAAALERSTAAAVALASFLDLMQKLITAAPAEQAEIVAAVRREYEASPAGTRQLRYALALAMPGHASSDPVSAQRLLRELVATPEILQPIERALANTELAQLTREIDSGAEMLRTQGELLRVEREKTAAANRKVKSEVEENDRLRKALEEARAKLDAIANIERSMTERQTNTEGRQP
jgi:hypothetical protein